jgi:uncharacterized protein YndB with AHSA1/START domain
MASLAAEVTIHVERPVDEVFDFVSDAARMPLWVRYVAEAEWTKDAEPRVGATFDIKYTYGARDSDITMEVTEFNPPARFAFMTVKGPYPIRVTYTLSADGRGTLFTYFQDAQSDGFITGCMFALLGFLLKYPTRGLLRKNAERMKAAIGGA